MSWRVEQAKDLWQRALDSLAVAGRDLSDGYCDLAASRAY
jgi:HEPN domain-containing protein